MISLRRGAPLILPLGLIASLLVVVVPLPPSVVDLLLAMNLGMAVLILLTTVMVKTPLEFNIFPTVLLVSALGRLVLNVATTRLILSNGDAYGVQAAGGMVQGFGQFVAGDSLVVGAIIFAILVIIQFLVITKGASRISEVSARFALDGMPGRQMAIDADLNAGAIDNREAQRRRVELARQADFYGAMDGASKYVRGDAVAGITIMAINLVAGLYIGLIESGMSLTDALGVYTKLTIGDGLVSQLPAFLVSLAAGLLITRSSVRTDVPIEFLRQILRRPEPLLAAAGFLGLLIFGRLPAMPLLLVATACVLMAWAVRGNDPFMSLLSSEETSTTTSQSGKAQRTAPKAVEEYLTVEPIEIELGVALLRLANPQHNGDLLPRITALRNTIALQLGIVLPKVRIHDNMQLPENAYRIKFFGDEVGSGIAYPLRSLAVGPDVARLDIEGIAARDPVSQTDAVWIDPAKNAQVTRQGARALPAVEVVVSHLRHLVAAQADRLLTRDATQLLLDRTRLSSPAVVSELVPALMSLAEVQQVLRGLLADGLSIRNLPAILEAMCDIANDQGLPKDRIQEVRRRMGRSLISRFTNTEGTLPAVTMASEMEDWWEQNPDSSGDSQQIVEAVCDQLRIDQSRGQLPIVVVRDSLRQPLQSLLRQHASHAIVLGRKEVEAFANIRPTCEVDPLWAVGANP